MAQNTPSSILCPNCGKLVSAKSETCFHCGYRNPGMWGYAPAIRNLLSRFMFADVVSIVCIVFYVISLALVPSAIFRFTGIFSLLQPDYLVLGVMGATSRASVLAGEWWTLITAMYLHGSLLHIVFNLLWVRQLAPEIEDYFGTVRLILIYTASGVFGFIFAIAFSYHGVIGASGAIFGLFGAIVYYGRDRGGAFGRQVYQQTAIWAAFLFFMGFTMDRVSNWAHAGGFIGGYLTAKLVGYTERRTENAAMKKFALATIAITGVAFAIIAFRVLRLFL